eukprot:353726-Chlamydomonas_euryale.AAC.3
MQPLEREQLVVHVVQPSGVDAARAVADAARAAWAGAIQHSASVGADSTKAMTALLKSACCEICLEDGSGWG